MQNIPFWYVPGMVMDGVAHGNLDGYVFLILIGYGAFLLIRHLCNH